MNIHELYTSLGKLMNAGVPSSTPIAIEMELDGEYMSGWYDIQPPKLEKTYCEGEKVFITLVDWKEDDL